MDLKTDDALNVDIDPALLLSYELDKLNLDNIPNDIFDQMKLNDESPPKEEKIDVKSEFLIKDCKVNESVSSNWIEVKIAKTLVSTDKSCNAEIKAETLTEYSEIKKDINGNDESVSEENLNELFVHLELSDSDNEATDDKDSIKERGPLRPRRHISRNRGENNLWFKRDSYDRSQFDSERLKFLSGSSHVQHTEILVPNTYTVYSNNVTSTYNGVECTNNLSSQESYFEDARASSVSSPESGYDSSSAYSITGSPPPVTSSRNLEIETVDEQTILDFLIENADSALIDNNLAACHIDDKDAKGKITEIINFLKDIPSDLCESSNVAANSHNTLETVPFPCHSTVSNTSNVKSSPISCNAVSKNVEMPKKLVPKLKDEAKRALRTFLSEEEYYAAKGRIYEKIREDKRKGQKISAIYIEDEMDKDSKKRTNLHNAVLKGNIEDIFSIVEIHKQYDLPFADINIRDKQGKTALDYAIQNQMTLVADYLKENTACQSVSIDK